MNPKAKARLDPEGTARPLTAIVAVQSQQKLRSALTGAGDAWSPDHYVVVDLKQDDELPNQKIWDRVRGWIIDIFK